MTDFMPTARQGQGGEVTSDGAGLKRTADAKRWDGVRRGYVEFGFRLAPDRKSLVPDPAEQDLLGQMLLWRAEGKSYTWIAGELDRRKVPARQGRRWARVSVSGILKRYDLPRVERTATPVPLARLRDEILARFDARRAAPSHAAMIRRAFRTLLGMEGVATTADLTPAILPRYFAVFPGVTESTRLTYLGVLKTICRTAVKSGYLADDPTRDHQVKNKRQAARGRGLNTEDLRRAMADLKRHSGDRAGRALYALAATVLYTGLRPNKAVKIFVAECALEDRKINISRKVRLKGCKLREEPWVFIPPELVPILAAWLSLAGPRWLFPNAHGTGPWHTSGYARGFKEAAERCGVSGLTLAALARYHDQYIRAAYALEPDPGSFPVLDLSRGPDRPPAVRGVPMKEPLSPSGFRLLKAMQRAGCGYPRNARLSAKGLKELDACRDPVRELKRLKKSPPLGTVIDFPDKKKGIRGYGLKTF